MANARLLLNGQLTHPWKDACLNTLEWMHLFGTVCLCVVVSFNRTPKNVCMSDFVKADLDLDFWDSDNF